MTYKSPVEKKLSVVLQQAQMVAFCIPCVGAEFAALASIFGAVFDSYAGVEEPRETYSAELAIDDLGRELVKLIGTSDDENQKLIAKLQLLRAANDGHARTFKQDGSVDDANTAIQALVQNPDWLKLLTNLKDDPAAIDRFGKQSLDANAPNCCTYFPVTPTDPEMTADDVKFLDTYVQGHTTYHALLTSTLKYIAATLGLHGKSDWLLIRSVLRDQLQQGLAMAVDHLCKIVTKLEDAMNNGDTNARAFAQVEYNKLGNGAGRPGPAYSLPYTREYRRIRNAAFLDQISVDQVKSYRGFIDAYYQTLTGLLASDAAPTIDPANPIPPQPQAAQPAQTGAHTGGTLPLGARQPKTARFLYETSSTGDYVGIVDNSTYGTGLVVTQNAGSAKPTLYYRVDGAGLNLLFNNALTAAGQLGAADSQLKAAYDTKYGPGQFHADSTANPTRQDRLTSFLVPLSPAGPIGDQILGMMYSAAPDISSTGLVDQVGYGTIYTDAMSEIAKWNVANPSAPIAFFRITMLSTATNAGKFAGATLNQTVAGIIVDRIVKALADDATHPKPVLQDLVILINNSEKAGSAERTAFDAAVAGGASLTTGNDGFDIAYPSGSATTPSATPPPPPPRPPQSDMSTPYWRDPNRPPPFIEDRYN